METLQVHRAPARPARASRAPACSPRCFSCLPPPALSCRVACFSKCWLRLCCRPWHRCADHEQIGYACGTRSSAPRKPQPPMVRLTARGAGSAHGSCGAAVRLCTSAMAASAASTTSGADPRGGSRSPPRRTRMLPPPPLGSGGPGRCSSGVWGQALVVGGGTLFPCVHRSARLGKDGWVVTKWRGGER